MDQTIKHHTRPVLKHVRRTIGTNIHNLRTDQSFTLEAFAEQAGIAAHVLSAYENGTQDIPLHIMAIISYRLNVPFSALLDGI